MTWQGGKLRLDDGALSFARLRSVAGPQDDAAKSLEQLSKALSGFAKPVRLHVRLVSGTEGEIIEDWLVQGGARNANAKQGRPKDADVTVVMRPETWAAIAQGRLAPYEALYAGRLRVGGNFETAKAIVKYMTDSATTYVAPC
jgi:putative sterol carrier protein